MKKKKIGIIGCGAIGTSLGQFIDNKLNKEAIVYALCDSELSQAVLLKRSLIRSRPCICLSQELIACCDFIIESATGKVSYSIAKSALSKGKDVLVLSIGGIVHKIPQLETIAKKHKAKLYLPSGAIAGLDGLQAVSLANIKKVVLTTRKPPRGLEGAPYIVRKGINLKKIRKETVVFSGSAAHAIRNFPKNVNVSALLSIAGIGADKTCVRVLCSPRYKGNSHEIHIESRAGSLDILCKNVAFINNPKTSYLAALSAMAVLKNMFRSIKIGI